MLNILPLNNNNRHHLERLNTAWIIKYFKVEPQDFIQLTNPECEIIDKGGFVFFAEMAGQVCGTVSLLKKEPGVYELGKMAVDESFQGKGIGRQLLVHAITHAQIVKAHKLILYSNTVLKPALSLYKSFGFKEVEMDTIIYSRSNIKMYLNLI